MNFAKTCNVSLEGNACLWNGDTDWRHWDKNKGLGEESLEDWAMRHPELAKISKKRREFYLAYFTKYLSYDFEHIVEDLNGKFLDFSNNRLDKTNHTILPSFFVLLNKLFDQERRFTFYIRTFGAQDRVVRLQKELNDFFKGPEFHNMAIKPRDISIMDHHIGVVHRDREGILLTFNCSERPEQYFGWAAKHFIKIADNDSKVSRRSFHVREGEDDRNGREYYEYAEEQFQCTSELEVFQFLEETTEAQQPLIIRDDFPWWKANRRERHCGKSLFISKGNKSCHPIFFDDNILVNKRDASIIDAYDIDSKQGLTFEECYGVYYYCAHIVKALDDNNYYADIVVACEKAREGQ